MKRKLEIISEQKQNAWAVLLNILQYNTENNENITDDNNDLLSDNKNGTDNV